MWGARTVGVLGIILGFLMGYLWCSHVHAVWEVEMDVLRRESVAKERSAWMQRMKDKQKKDCMKDNSKESMAHLKAQCEQRLEVERASLASSQEQSLLLQKELASCKEEVAYSLSKPARSSAVAQNYHPAAVESPLVKEGHGCYKIPQTRVRPLAPYGHRVYDEASKRSEAPGADIHIITHTHWDREWYRPLEQFTRLLVSTVDNVLEQLESVEDTGFFHFHLDSQSVLLEDYLAARPELQRLMVDLINNNQIGLGPWYTQPDEFLVSGEAIIRNLLYGIITMEELNATYSRVGYIPDQFGHTSQMPQIFAGFELFAAATMRGAPPGTPHNSMWESPDGTQILLLRFSNYCGMHFNEKVGPEVSVRYQVDAEAQRWRDAGQTWDGVSTFYWMNGCDHRDVDTQVGAAVRDAKASLKVKPWNLTLFQEVQRKNPSNVGSKEKQELLLRAVRTEREATQLSVKNVYHSNLEDVARLVVDEVARKSLQLKVNYGEMRSGVDHLADVTSSGMSLKRRNWAAQELLENWAEPLNVAAAADGAPDEQASLRRAWKLVLENHFHDTLCTTSAPQVLRDSRGRAERAIAIAEAVSSQHMGYLMKAASPFSSQKIFVFNPSNVERVGELVVAMMQFPINQPGGLRAEVLPSRGQVVSFDDVESGQSVSGTVIQSFPYAFSYRHREGLFREGTTVGLMKVAFRPTVGPNQMRLFLYTGVNASAQPTKEPKKSNKSTRVPVEKSLQKSPESRENLRVLDNEILRVALNPFTGSVNITRAGGSEFPFLNTVQVVQDSGSQYQAQYGIMNSKWEGWTVEAHEENAEFQLITLKTSVLIDHSQQEPINLTMHYLLPASSKVLWVRVSVYNPEHGRNFAIRAIHRIPFAVSSMFGDMAFDHVQRALNEPAPVTKPHHKWCAALDRDGSAAFGVAGRALYESRFMMPNLEMTLMRAVNRIQDWAWFPNEGAQDFGRHAFEYALILPDQTQAKPNPIAEIDLEARRFVSALCPVQHIDWGMLASIPLTCVSRSSFTQIVSPGAHPFDEGAQGDMSSVVMEPDKLAKVNPVRILVCSVSPASLVLSTVKRAERLDGYIVRVYNPTEGPIEGSISFARPITSASYVNLNEKPSERDDEATPPKISDKGFSITALSVKPGRIVTLHVRSARKSP